MWRSLRLVALLCAIPTTLAAHPGTGIVIDRQGNVYFVDMVSGVWKTDRHGQLTHLSIHLFKVDVDMYLKTRIANMNYFSNKFNDGTMRDRFLKVDFIG